MEAYRTYGESPTDGLLAGFLLGPEELRQFAGDGPVHTDDLPFLEFSTPGSLYLPQGVADNRKEIFRFKKADFPPFLVIPPSELPHLYQRIGKYLLNHSRPDEATRAFFKASALGQGPPPPQKHLTERTIAAIGPSGTIVETFDGQDRRIPIIPYLGGYRPDEEDRAGLVAWSANMDYFASISGIVQWVGRGGSAALSVRSIADVASAGYFIPMAVRPATTYRVEFQMKSFLSLGGDAGAGILEYDALLPSGEEFTLHANRSHRIGSNVHIRIRSERDWEKYTYTFKTSSRARMVHLLFFREGLHNREPVIFDDIVIREVR